MERFTREQWLDLAFDLWNMPVNEIHEKWDFPCGDDCHAMRATVGFWEESYENRVAIQIQFCCEKAGIA